MIAAALADAVRIEVVPQLFLNGDLVLSVLVRKALAAKRAAIPLRIISVLFTGRGARFVVFELV